MKASLIAKALLAILLTSNVYAAVSDGNKSCEITSQKLYGQVCDFTGKCVYTKRNTSYNCVEVKQELIGYKSYKTVTSDGNVTVAPIYYENKDFKGQLVPAFATAAQMDNQVHIFSGWSGMCEKGTFTDFSWTSDPMFWAGLAMQAYSAAGDGTFGSTAQETINNINSSFDSFTGASRLITPTDGSSAFEQLNTIKDFDGYYKVTYTGLASTGAQIYAAASASDTQQMATEINFGASGRAGGGSVMAKAYNSCMASLGLSYANQISYVAGADANITGVNIQQPWKNPLRMSSDSLQKLGALVGKNFFEMSYMQQAPDNMGMTTVVALNSAAYVQAGQVVCGGYKIAAALNLQNTAAATAQANQASRTDAMANAAVSGALGMLPPPYNMAATIAFKVLTSFSDGNACNDKNFAMSLSPLQYKTYMFKSNNPSQCHYIKEECSAKWMWGDCMRQREKYCCYDQISTRIFAESVYEQMNKSWDSCQGVGINDFKNINFRKCLAGENPATNKCISSAKYNELERALLIQMNKGIPVDNLVNQIKNAVGQ